MRAALLVSTDLDWALELAAAWRRAGDDVALVLLDRAAAAVRPGHASAGGVRSVIVGGAAVAVHDDALCRRGIARGAVPDGVKVVTLDEVADLVAESAQRVVWL